MTSLDLKNDNLWKLMRVMALPGIIATILISLNTFIDSFYIGYFIGANALAGVSLVIPLTIFTTAVMVMIASGSASVLSRAIGSGDKLTQRKVISTLFTMSIIASFFLMLIGYFLADQLLLVMGAAGQVLRYGADFYQTWSLGVFFTIFGLSANSLIRAEGKIKQAMFFSVIAVLINVILAPLFIHYLHLGIRGAALASSVAMMVYALLTLNYFKSGKASFETGKIGWLWDITMLKSIVAVGFSAFFIQVINFIRQIFIFKSMAYYGTNWDLAFFSTVFRIFTFAVMPVFGLLQVLQPVVGINYGAQNYERCVKAVKIFRKSGSILLLIIALPLFVFPHGIVAIMLPGQSFTEEEITFFRAILCIIPLFPIGTSGIIFFQAMGKGKLASILSICRELFLFIPLILFLPAKFGSSGLYYSILVENFLYFTILFCITSFEFKKIKMLPIKH